MNLRQIKPYRDRHNTIDPISKTLLRLEGDNVDCLTNYFLEDTLNTSRKNWKFSYVVSDPGYQSGIVMHVVYFFINTGSCLTGSILSLVCSRKDLCLSRIFLSNSRDLLFHFKVSFFS